MRLIDAEAFEESIEQIEWYHLAGNGEMVQGATSGNGWYKEQDIYNAIEEAPTIEAKPIVHAHVIEHQGYEDEYYCECSNCHTHEVWVECKYCSECGAQMDEPFSQDHEIGVKIPVINMEDVPKIMEEMEK